MRGLFLEKLVSKMTILADVAQDCYIRVLKGFEG